MSMVSRTAFKGKLLVDAVAAKDVLYRLESRGRLKLKRIKQGVDKVQEELATAIPEYAVKLGLGPDVPKRVAEYLANIEQLKPIRDDAQELARAAEESIAFYEDAIEVEIGAVATSVKRRQRKDPSVGVPFERTLEYQGLYAEKAVATRRKNKKAEAEGLAPVKAKGKAKAKPKAEVAAEEVNGEEKPG